MRATLQRGVASMQALLNDLIELARLEAGQERRTTAAFDAAALLEELCEGTRPLAVERGLALDASGRRRCRSKGTESRRTASRRT